MIHTTLKSTAIFAFAAFGMFTQSAEAQQTQGLGNQAYEVAELVAENEHDLSRDERRQVRGLLEQIRALVGTSVFNISISGGQFTHDLAYSADVNSTSDFLGKCLTQFTRHAYYVNSLKTTVDYSRSANQEFRNPTFYTSGVQICASAAGLAADMGVPVLPADRYAGNVVAFSVQNKPVILKGRSLQEIGRACHNTNAINDRIYAFDLPMSINGAQLLHLRKSGGSGFTSKSEACEAVVTTVAKSIRNGEGIFRDRR